MGIRTTFLESFNYVPQPGWTRAAFTVLRAGKVAAAPDYRVERAAHPGQDVIYCLSGRGMAETAGTRLDVGPGQLVWLANEAPHMHAADPDEPWTVLWFRFDGPNPAALRTKLFAEGPPRAQFAEGSYPVAWFERLFAVLRSRDAGLDLRLNALVADFVAAIDSAGTGDAARDLPAPVAEAIVAMRADLSLPWSATDLSRVAGLTPSQMRRLFARHLRQSPRQWLIRERLMQAQSLLAETGASIIEIAERCGFCDVYHFGREFKRSVGMPPAQWRRSERGAGPVGRQAAPRHSAAAATVA
jgi:AraC-like DNA-binding protein